MPQLYSLHGRLVGKEEYEKARGINQPVKKKEKEVEVKEKNQKKNQQRRVSKKAK